MHSSATELLNSSFFYETHQSSSFLWNHPHPWSQVRRKGFFLSALRSTYASRASVSLICFGCVLHLLHQQPFVHCVALALFLSQTKCPQPKSGRHRTDTGAARHTGRGAGGGAGTSKECGWHHAEIIQTWAGSTLVSSPNTPGWLLLQDHCICCSCSLAPSF